MTRDSIDAMPPGPKMDELVAIRVLGWVYVTSNDEGQPRLTDPHDGNCKAPPSFSTDRLEADKMVIQAAADRAWTGTVESHLHLKAARWHHRVHLGGESTEGYDYPLLACRAALKAVADD